MALRKRKLVFRVFAVLILGLLVLAVAAPLWFPWVLRPAAGSLNLSYSNYEREGYNRFQLLNVQMKTTSGTFHAKQVNGFVPTTWAWKAVTGSRTEPFLFVHDWEFNVESNTATNETAPSVSESSIYSSINSLKQKLASLKTTAPRAELTNGVIHWGKINIAVPQATWTNGDLTAQLRLPKEQALDLQADVVSNGTMTVALNSDSLNLHSQIALHDPPEKLDVHGALQWLGNSVEINATFPTNGTLPESGSIRAPSFSIPASVLKLPGYTNVTGSLNAVWSTNKFTVDLAAQAVPQAPNLPPIHLDLRASGNTNRAQIDTAEISSPWLTARLSRETQILFRPPYLAEPASLSVSANLDQQPWFAARGRISGQAELRPAAARFPRASFTLSGSGIMISNIAVQSLQLAGDFLWPRVQFTRFEATMGEGSALSLTGNYNIQTKIVGDGRLDFSGGFGRQFLPKGYSFDSVKLSAQFAGPINSLTNSGTISITNLTVPKFNSLEFAGKWNGRGMDFQNLAANLRAGDSSLSLRGAINLAHTPEQFRIGELNLSRNGEPELSLQQPFTATVRSPATNATAQAGATNEWMLSLSPVQLSGTNRDLRLAGEVAWPNRGALEVSASGLDSKLIQDFVAPSLPDSQLHDLNLKAGWTNGPVQFQLAARATVQTGEQLPFTATAKLSGGPRGIAIQDFSVSSQTQSVAQVQGMLPFLLTPAATNGMVQIADDGALRLKARTEPDSVLWNKISAATGVRLQGPELSADVQGTWNAPQGQVALRARRIEFSETNHPLPAIDNLKLNLELNRDSARLSQLTASVQGQPVEITGQLPLGSKFWSRLRQTRSLPDWRDASARVKIPEAKLAAFSEFLPKELTDEGSFQADVRLEPGGKLNGEISLENVRTRPLENIGPIRDIHGTMLLSGQTATLTNTSVNIGGQTVNIAGRGAWDEAAFRTNGLPPFQVRLTGTNVPLVRKPSLLLRADLDVGVTNTPGSTPVVAGTVRLRHSLFLADLHSLVPEKTASPKARPPYFSIETQPWADWQLALNVTGDGFMRVQTPLFRGTASTTMKLQGTLKEPIALGEAKIDSGEITFPFGSLAVQQGFVSLTSENPYHPELYVTASAQRFGYDIKMEVTGPADKPVVQFTSMPPLTSEQIVLMLTTGQLPRGAGMTSTTQQRAQGLAMFLGKNLLSEFGIGGGESRLSVTSGAEISEAGKPTYDVEYKLSKRWSIIGEYDRFDQFNLNLKWKVYSK